MEVEMWRLRLKVPVLCDCLSLHRKMQLKRQA